MKRVAFQMKVKKEQLKEYVKWHENVWPEMIEALKRSGWKNYSLFMRKDGMILGYPINSLCIARQKIISIRKMIFKNIRKKTLKQMNGMN